MKTFAPVLALLGLILAANYARADCIARIDEVRAQQAKAPYLDPKRPDLPEKLSALEAGDEVILITHRNRLAELKERWAAQDSESK
jgi:hypothetical protein